MEQAKHLEPKFSEAFQELARFLSDLRVSHYFYAHFIEILWWYDVEI